MLKFAASFFTSQNVNKPFLKPAADIQSMQQVGSALGLQKISNGSFTRNFVNTEQLSSTAIQLLEDIRLRDLEVYNNLLKELDNISNDELNDDLKIYIKGHHFNTVVDLLAMQKALAANICGYIHKYLEKVGPKTLEIIQNLRKKHLPNVDEQAKCNNLTHHSLDHSTELKVRSMQVIIQDLQIFNSNSNYDIFMRNILSFALECHDYLQGKPNSGYVTVEEQSAALVFAWLSGEDGFPNLTPEVLLWMQYQVKYMIPVATTVAFSFKNPLHLSRLLAIFEKACLDAKIPVYDDSNYHICSVSQVVAQIVGCFDTIAYAMCSQVIRQANSNDLKTAAYLAQLSGNSLLQETMRNENLDMYYPKESLDYNFQAFAISLVPKLGMTIELANKSQDEQFKQQAILIGNFIRFMKTLFMINYDFSSILPIFEELFTRLGVAAALEESFFQEKTINNESIFALSNLERAKIATETIANYLRNFVLNTIPVDNVIQVGAIEADAINIKKLYAGYKKLQVEEKNQVLKEIVLNLIVQAGRNYLKYPELENLSDPSPVKIALSDNQVSEETKSSENRV